MKTQNACSCIVMSLAVVALISGCATTTATKTTQVHQFEPLPVAKVHSQDLKPEKPQSVTDLLREAQEEFAAATKAQEDKDSQGALDHYSKMLDLLAKANLDASMFYNLRDEFERILNNSQQHGGLPSSPPASVEGLVGPDQGKYGDLAIEFPLHERVLDEIEEIQKLYPKQFQAGLDRSFKYLPHIRAEFAKAGLPQDLVWLAMVESQFHPKVVSRAGAGGLWQFMRGTGQRYNLRVDRYIDERFNWQKATQAAICYLRDLNTKFDGNWSLAVTAYNMGEGGLERAIASTGGVSDLWKLLETPPASNQMQQETKKFYPKLVASILVAKDPERFGFKSNPQPADDSVRVPIQGSYSLKALEQVCGLAPGTLVNLNPDLVRGVTPPSGGCSLAVPANMTETVLASLPKLQEVRPEVVLASTPSSGRSRGSDRVHLVRRGETLSSIAKKHGISTEELMKANRIRTARYVQPGRKLNLPDTAVDAREVEEAAGEPQKKEEAESAVYVVKKGDTLSEIAKKHKVSIKDLLHWNKKKDPVLHEGDKLTLKNLAEMGETGEPKTPQEELIHTVRSGESCDKIARQYGVKLEDLLAWNNLGKETTINIGKKLVIRGCEEPAAPEKDSAEKAAPAEAKASAPEKEKVTNATHTVAKGETASGIAAKYKVQLKDLLAWNNLKADSVVQIGDKLKIQGAAKEAPAKKTQTAAKTEKAEPAKAKEASEKPAEESKPAGKKTTHTVAKGECASTIAARYHVKISDLYKWNGWSKDKVLQVGQQVVVYAN